jgi:hypothetical protein
MRNLTLVVCVGLSSCLIGCALQEVRSKTKMGPEYRHRGNDRTDQVRWTVQQGVDFKWDKGVTTGLTYRRRDMDQGNGDNDNGVWFDFSFPIWRAPKKPDRLTERVEVLEKRLAEVERKLAEAKERTNAGT